MKNQLLSYLLCLFLWACNNVSAQTLPVGTPLLEETARRLQVTGKLSIETSFTLRPLFAATAGGFDSLYYPAFDSAQALQAKSISFAKGKGRFVVLPLQLRQQFNSHHPYGWSDGAMIPAKGYQALASAGVYAKLGALSIQLQPELVYAQNSAFTTFPSAFSDSIWRSYYINVLNKIDAPERFGNSSYIKFFPGQSSVRLNIKNLSFGASTENIWWGPGERSSLMMSNNAPGFPHLTFNTSAPVKTGIGSFEWQVLAGLIAGSDILPDDTSRTFDGLPLYSPKPDGKRYINAFMATWQPKWTPGLYLGFSRAFYQYKASVPKSLNGYLPVVGAFFKNYAQDENAYGRDQMLSLFFRLVLPESRTELYGEFGRNDHSQDQRDLLLEPEHARAYLFGARKYFTTTSGTDFSLFFEMTQLQKPSTLLVRALESWYTHYQVRHGYTHKGQVLGAGIGPGASSQTFGLSWYKGIQKTGVTFERVVRNNDFYFDAFNQPGSFSRHWVDFSLNLSRSWQRSRIIYSANLSAVRSYNYQWRTSKMAGLSKDVTNVFGAFSIGYLF